MAIESNLPENKARWLDQQVYHWEEVKRSIGTAVEFCSKALHCYATSPQAPEQAILGNLRVIEMALRDDLRNANRMLEAAIHAAEECCCAKCDS